MYDAERRDGASVYVCRLCRDKKLNLTGKYRTLKLLKGFDMSPNCMPVEGKDDCDIDCMSPIDKASELRALYKEYTRFSDLLSSLEDDGYTIDMSSEEYIKIYKEI